MHDYEDMNKYVYIYRKKKRKRKRKKKQQDLLHQITAAHIGHGSKFVYRLHPCRSLVFRAFPAFLIATTSPCALGSQSSNT